MEEIALDRVPTETPKRATMPTSATGSIHVSEQPQGKKEFKHPADIQVQQSMQTEGAPAFVNELPSVQKPSALTTKVTADIRSATSAESKALAETMAKTGPSTYNMMPETAAVDLGKHQYAIGVRKWC